MKKYLLIYLFLLASFSAKSQVENTLFHMPSLPQSAHYNPGKFLDYDVAITLPGLSGGNCFCLKFWLLPSTMFSDLSLTEQFFCPKDCPMRPSKTIHLQLEREQICLECTSAPKKWVSTSEWKKTWKPGSLTRKTW